MQKLKAVIIKGNPKFIEGNKLALDFYKEIREYLAKLSYEVTEDPGEPYTSPPEANLWIGHSRGVDRLRFPKGSVRTLAIGSASEGAINHPLDNTKDSFGESKIIPNEYHYVLTDEMKGAILDITNQLNGSDLDLRTIKTIEDYSAIADLYIKDFGTDYLHFEVIDEVILILKGAELDKELKVDLGSGPGTIIKYLLENSISNLEAVELVDKFYSYLVKTFEPKGVNVLHSDMRSDIARRISDSVGCYLAGYSLIHIPDEEIPNFFQDIYRTLKSKGIFFLSVQEGTYKGMEAEPYQTQKDKRFNSNEKFECYMNYFTEEELRKHLEQSGFTILKFYRFAQKPMPGELDVDKLWVIAQKRK